MSSSTCPECGASYASDGDSCSTRFDQLLALDHSRQEPWGSRHGQAFSAFALQHAQRHSRSLDSAWQALYRIYVLNQQPIAVYTDLRGTAGRAPHTPSVPPRPESPAATFDVTIADLNDFSASSYAEQLDRWCRSALRGWGAGPA